MARSHPLLRSLMFHILPPPVRAYHPPPVFANTVFPAFALRQFHCSSFALFPRLQTQAVADETTRSHSPSPSPSSLFTSVDVSRGEGFQSRELDEESDFVIEAPGADSEDSRVGLAEKKTVRFKVLHDGEHSLADRSIPWYTWRVLRGLRDAGYEAYLVGGSVRDLFLKATPKDFDVLSTANPHEVKKLFPGKAIVVGRRFPICHVRAGSIITEVSSFSTEVRDLKGKGRKKQVVKAKKRLESQAPPAHSRKYEWDDRDTARWRNSLKRDFTVNGLMYEPFTRVMYDYVGAVRDLKARKVRTISPAEESFTEDAARYIRAIRIAARLGLSLDGNVARMLENSAPAVANVGKSRLMAELHILIAHGAAEPSLRLLWRFRLLELLLPLQAEYLRSVNFARRSKKSNFLFDLMANMDRLNTPDKPCNGGLWTALLGFHLAVVECDPPKVVTATAALAVHDRKGVLEAAKRAERIHKRVTERQQNEGLVDTPGEEGFGDAHESEKDDEKNGLTSEKYSRTGASQGKHVDSDTTKKAVEGIARAAMKLLVTAQENILDHVDYCLTAKLTKERLGLDVGDLVVIPKNSAHRARKMLTDTNSFLDGRREVDNYRQKVSKPGRRDRKEEKYAESDEVDDTMKTSTFMFSRIVLNTLYPRIP